MSGNAEPRVRRGGHLYARVQYNRRMYVLCTYREISVPTWLFGTMSMSRIPIASLIATKPIEG